MNWDAIGAIAEALGALGVIVSLIYLASQIRHNTAAIRSQTAQQVTNRGGEISQAIAWDPAISEVHARGLREPESLSEKERIQFAGVLLTIFRAYENVEYQFRSGFLDEDEWSGLHRNLLFWVCQPGFRWWWTTSGARSGFSQRFQQIIDDSIASSPSAPDL